MPAVFIRRGNVLFLLKSPQDFFQRLHRGKIRSSDALLVRSGCSMQWLPINEVREFQAAGLESQAISFSSSRAGLDPLDHIREPKFNLSAFCGGPFWYFRHGMKSRGCLGVLLLVALYTALFAFHHYGNPLPLPLLIMTAGIIWLGLSCYFAGRADSDLNHLQIQRFHQARSEASLFIGAADPENLLSINPTARRARGEVLSRWN